MRVNGSDLFFKRIFRKVFLFYYGNETEFLKIVGVF